MATDIVDQKQLAERLLQQAEEQNIELVGPGGLLNQLTKNVLETALDAEMAEHLGYEKHDPAGQDSWNSRNGTRAKTVLREIGPVEIEVPRDTESTFEPQIVRKRQRRLTGVDEIVLSLTARGLTTGEIAAHFQEVYGAKISKDTVSRITEKVTGEMTEWLNRPLEKIYPVIFIDAMVVKVRDGQVANKPVYVVIGVTVDGERDILGLWAGDGGEGAKFWLSVFTEIKNRGVQDVCIAVCDGLKGLPEAITTTWELAIVQACVIHLIRNTFRFASRKYWEEMSRDLRPVYTAPSEAVARERFTEFDAKWGKQAGLNWSSQHLDRGGVRGQVSGVDDWEGADEVAGASDASPGARAVVLAGDRWGFDQCGCGGGCRCVLGGWRPVVQGTWRDANVHAGPNLRPVSVVPGARGDRDAQGAGRRSPGDRSPVGAFSVDDLAGAAPQRCNSRREARLSRVGRAMEVRAGCVPPEDREARHQRSTPRVRAGATLRAGSPARRDSGTGTQGSGLEGTGQTTTPGPQVGNGVEP
jgi:putative transposase